MPSYSIIHRLLGRSEKAAPAVPLLYDKAAASFEPSEQQSVWDHPAWLDASNSYVGRLRGEATEDRLAPEAYLAPIALLASQVAKRQGMVKILDLGGGVGPCVDVIMRGLLEAKYVVVDGAASCEQGSLMFANDHRVSFAETLPNDGEMFDIAMFSSALQYIDSWRLALAALANRVAENGTLVINRIPVSSNETVALRQHISLGQPPACIGSVWHWVFSRDELIREAQQLGYLLIYDQFIRDVGPEMTQAAALGRVDLRLLMFSKDSCPPTPVHHNN
ncbi:methyltransferase, TIGR04325 family [Cyanobium sp. Lug-B]|mgnify:CR=1 FL=1|uniref:methyltransferase, TIGR04325 family n=1 Tax=Cyanobium sp. Lug-B TaxID=2823716 RepID=UPI0020CF4F09|nr:methyltransferase, TIGR04325 family [Cyanobium sp. Lug-B]MCP9796841.1 methyltransferase, TIGR04325 family [Cyanobium sp. Lug-B]